MPASCHFTPRERDLGTDWLGGSVGSQRRLGRSDEENIPVIQHGIVFGGTSVSRRASRN
jgi:hypothetical protein